MLQAAWMPVGNLLEISKYCQDKQTLISYQFDCLSTMLCKIYQDTRQSSAMAFHINDMHDHFQALIDWIIRSVFVTLTSFVE